MNNELYNEVRRWNNSILWCTVEKTSNYTFSCLLNYAEVKIYVMFQFARRYGQWISTTTVGAVTAISKTMECHIWVASSIQEHKTVPFNTTADVTIKFLLDCYEYSGINGSLSQANSTAIRTICLIAVFRSRPGIFPFDLDYKTGYYHN